MDVRRLREEVMDVAMYMTQFSYTAEAWKALVKRPEDRAAVFAEHAEKLGGRMVSFYYCMGEFDGVVIYEAPDDQAAAAIVLTVSSPGHLKDTKTTSLMTVEETMGAMERAKAEAYPAPKLWSPMPS